MDNQKRSLDPSDSLQLYLASLRDEFQRSLAESLRRSGDYRREMPDDSANASAAFEFEFEFVVDGSRRAQRFQGIESSRSP